MDKLTLQAEWKKLAPFAEDLKNEYDKMREAADEDEFLSLVLTHGLKGTKDLLSADKFENHLHRAIGTWDDNAWEHCLVSAAKCSS